MVDMTQDETSLKKAKEILQNHNSLEASLAEARRYAGLGIDALKTLPAHPLRQSLEDLIVFSVERKY